MSEEEKEFGFDVKSIDWKDYINNIHILGLRRHVMNERGMGSSCLNFVLCNHLSYAAKNLVKYVYAFPSFLGSLRQYECGNNYKVSSLYML